MNTALLFIKAYVKDLNVSDQEYTDAMTLTGTKVEGFEKYDKNLDKIVVGQILSIEKHPDADKLIICQVDTGVENASGCGSKVIQIVTGASNVKVGDKVPVVLDGGKVAGGHDGGALPENGIVIKNGKLRGVESFGMMCAIEELGCNREMYPEAPENGIYIFDESAVVGSDAIEELGLHDTSFEYEITSNRVDCYSVIGIAREAAATFKKEFVLPEVVVKGNGEDVNNYIKVRVEDPDLCTRYIARVCTNIQIGPSPKWMQRRLASCGIRPINNLVDITNYVMEEYGQPMHAFDLETVEDHQIVVKRAKDGEEFMTLDGQVRKLDKDILMICDAKKEIGIAGIMGGENSKITDNVKTVVFESAVFNGANIRKSAKRLGLRTDASGKFEKGVEPHNAMDAINRACQLIEEFGCGEVTNGVVDINSGLNEKLRIPFEPKKYNELLGTSISDEDMLAILKPLEIEYEKSTNELIIPYFRQDLLGQADIAEEIARFFGYDKIPTTLPKGEYLMGKIPYKMVVEGEARRIALFNGFSQAMTYSFESPKVFDKLLLKEDNKLRDAIVIANPLGEDFSVMRTSMMNGMLSSLSTNYNRRNKEAKLFELSNIYVAKELPLTDYPDERMQFVLGMYGSGDFFSMKGVIEEFLEAVGMNHKTEYNPNCGKEFLHPGRCANIVYDNTVIGFLGEIHPTVAENYSIKTKAYVAVLDMPFITEYSTFDRKFTGIAKYPAVSRDISMVVPKTILAGDIEKMIAQRGGKILESYQLFDIYEGEQIKEGFKSMAYSVTFRAKDKTLEEQEVATAMKKILNGLETMGIELRQ